MVDSIISENPSKDQEVWKDIPGYPGYQVSDCGNVRSYWKENGRKPAIISDVFKVLKQSYHHRGRPAVNVTVNKKSKNVGVHRLVLYAFVGPCPDGCEACHNDGNHLNNHISNLRWDTRKSNFSDRVKHGTACIGEKQPMSVLTDEDIIAIRVMYSKKISSKCLAELFKVHPATITHVTSGKGWKHISGPITKNANCREQNLYIYPSIQQAVLT
jgi:hypothetical protein